MVARGFRGFEELFFHIVIYKHLREFYIDAPARGAASERELQAVA